MDATGSVCGTKSPRCAHPQRPLTLRITYTSHLYDIMYYLEVLLVGAFHVLERRARLLEPELGEALGHQTLGLQPTARETGSARIREHMIAEQLPFS
jgi:hypothetical protein